MSLSPWLREALPIGLRRTLRRGQRLAVDLYRGTLSVPSPCEVDRWHAVATVEQALGTTPNARGKQHNIALAAAAFSARPIRSGAEFSFWRWLGSPSQGRGFQDGRALRGGELVLETGGGLCQLAGALYFVGLQAGLNPLERHAHSVDLYTDDTRYAPLGSDATVSHGFKDLRLANPHACAVAFEVQAAGNVLQVKLLAEHPIAPASVDFRRAVQPDGSQTVETWRSGAMLARTRYGKLSSSASAKSPV